MEEEIIMKSVWLRRIGDKIEVLIEIDNKYYLAIQEDINSNFSHCAHAAGKYTWKEISFL